MPNKTVKDRDELRLDVGTTDFHFDVARSFELINCWNAALNGHLQLNQALMAMVRQFGARNIVLYRLEKDAPHIIAAITAAEGTSKLELSSGKLTCYVRDNHILLPGATFWLNQLQLETTFKQSPAQREWIARPDIIDVCIMILDGANGRQDILEMIFDFSPNTNPDIPVRLIATAMANAWEKRSPGLVSRRIQDFSGGRSDLTQSDETDILGPRNPSGLSRAELRVCQLLVDGENAKNISEALGLSLSTIRTHLRNIYAKTATDGQVRLIALINARKANQV